MLSLADARSRRFRHSLRVHRKPPSRERSCGFPGWNHLHANIVPITQKCYTREDQSLCLALSSMFSVLYNLMCVSLATKWSYNGSMITLGVPVGEHLGAVVTSGR